MNKSIKTLIANLRTLSNVDINELIEKVTPPTTNKAIVDKSLHLMLTLPIFDTKHDVGTVGNTTPFKDVDGIELKIGDTVDVVRINDSDDEHFITWVCEDLKPFVMGIEKACNADTGEISGYKVRRVKRYDELKVGDKQRFVTVEEF